MLFWSFRLLGLLLFMAGGVAFAISLELTTPEETFLFAAFGSIIWFAWDNLQERRLMQWLHKLLIDPAASVPKLDSIRREMAERVERLLRQKHQHLTEQEARLHNLYSVLQAFPGGLVILDEQWRIEWCNRMACDHFDLDEERDLSQLVTHLLREPALVNCLTSRRFGEPVLLESFVKTGSKRSLRLELRLLSYGSGRLFMLSRDVTAIEQAEIMRRDFVANVSHEIRTPLTVLSGFIEILQNLELEEAVRKDYLERMAQQTARMKSLVEDLLLLSRLNNSALPSEAQEWSPVGVLLDRIEVDARALSENLSGHENGRQEIIFEGMDTPLEIIGLASELISAFFNLVSNAIRYTPANGKIIVSWRSEPDGGARFSVWDNGPGIASEHIPRLTERFYRVDSARSRASGGTGLGLAIVKHVLQRHDASLVIESTPGRGSTFTAVLPATRLRVAALE